MIDLKVRGGRAAVKCNACGLKYGHDADVGGSGCRGAEDPAEPEYECEKCDRLCFGLPCERRSLCPWCCRCGEDED